MFSLSTSWNSRRHTNGRDIVNEIKRLGFDTIELGFQLPEAAVRDILAVKNSGGIKVSSVHNICPIPPGIDPRDASPDIYSISSLNEDERSRAVLVTKGTIRYARLFGARVVILHAGRVEVKDRTRKLASLIDDKKAFEALRIEMAAERRSKSPPHIASVMKSLKELIPYAENTGMRLALETRYYYREIPDPNEMEYIFGQIGKNRLFYWHDTGHAEVFRRLGFGSHKAFLEKNANRLIGVHLHDILNQIDDHKAPGQGDFDFRMLKPYIVNDVIKVIEAHGEADEDDILRSVEYLTNIFETL